MSVMLLTNETYSNVAESLCRNQNWMIKGKLGDWKRIKSIVTEWFELNCLSYSERYNETVEAFKPNLEKGKKVSNVQLLKSLQCIRYNIEFKGENDNITIKQLDKLINVMKDVVIDELPEYDTAQWG